MSKTEINFVEQELELLFTGKRDKFYEAWVERYPEKRQKILLEELMHFSWKYYSYYESE